MADTSKAKNPAQVEQWYKFSIQMRDHAAALNAAIHAHDPHAADKSMKKLAQSCDDCHDVFKEKK
jgi:cytochrome c556